MKPASYDVVIVGAGITGLALGLALHQGGLRVRVLEHAPLPHFVPEPGFDARIYALSLSSQAWLQQLGSWAQQDAGRVQPILGMDLWGDRQGRLQFGAAQSAARLNGSRAAPVQGYIAEAGALLEGLLRQVRVQAPDLVQVPETVLAVEHEPTGLLLRLQRAAPLRCALLVAADGVHSPLRTHMGINATFKNYDHQAVVANYRTNRPHGGIARQWFGAGEVLALLPLPGNHVSLVWSARKAHALRLLEKTPAQRVAALQGVIGPRQEDRAAAAAADPEFLEELTAPRGFDLRLMRPETLVLPRFALLGDAAHGVHPMAGQGLNLGLQDAATLTTVLLNRGPGPDCGDWSLLRRYARARQEPILAMQGLTDGLYRLFGSEQWGLPQLRNWGLNRVNQWNWLKNRLIAHANA